MPLRNGMLTINELRHLSQKHLQAATLADGEIAVGGRSS